MTRPDVSNEDKVQSNFYILSPSFFLPPINYVQRPTPQFHTVNMHAEISFFIFFWGRRRTNAFSFPLSPFKKEKKEGAGTEGTRTVGQTKGRKTTGETEEVRISLRQRKKEKMKQTDGLFIYP